MILLLVLLSCTSLYFIYELLFMDQNRAFLHLKFKKTWKSRIEKRHKRSIKVLDCHSYTRRKFLSQVQSVGLCTFVSLGLSSFFTSCALWEAKEVRIGKISDWEANKFLTAELNEATIFVSKDERNILYALDLTCTHKQCTVRYKEEIHGFKCPCHKGIFDIMGKVLEGRPPRDLARLKVELRGDDVWAVRI